VNPFSSHLHLAHHYWKSHLKPGDQVVDATCGNGHDTLFLSRLVLENDKGLVVGLDIQEQAIKSTELLLTEKLSPELKKRVRIFQQSHEKYPPLVTERSVQLIVYNLGYLPGGNKSVTTQTFTTLESVKNYFNLLSPHGIMSITCYPGHLEGAKEEFSLLQWIAELPFRQWNVCHHRWVNRINSPSLLIIKKIY
jgi:SAM-dependent methyltransferase